MPLLLAVTLAATLIPLNDLGPAPYDYGYIGGLWDDGTNTIPADHAAAGLHRASLIQPLDADGHPSPDGKVGFIVAGFNETSMIANAFADMTRDDPRVRHDVIFVNAAMAGIDATHWTRDDDLNYDRIRNVPLRAAGLTEKQVQAAWVELADDYPYLPLPIQFGDAYLLKSNLAGALRAMKKRWPNLQVAYLSSRVYGGYATTNWNPEPYAYEAGLSVRWIVLGQISFMRDGSIWDTRISSLDYEKGVAPWVTWGPYLWANGTTPRSDGLTWQRDDFAADGETISDRGARKAAQLLFDFMLHEPTAQWFRATDVPPRTRPMRSR
jgi:hypothetical protein